MKYLNLFRRSAPRRSALDVDIACSEHKADPYPFYAKLRAEFPVHPVTLPDGQTAWLISRYLDVVAALKDERLVKNRISTMSPQQIRQQPWMPAFAKPLTQNMLDLDPPDHARLRALVQKAFTPRLVSRMSSRIETLSRDLISRVKCESTFDLIHSYALPIPTTIIAEMLGVPEQDQRKFHTWSSIIVCANSSSWGMLKAVPAIWRFLRYIRRLIRSRRATPRDDLTSALVYVDQSGATFSEDELVAMIFLLLVAGHETTVNLIGNGTLALLDNAEQLERLRGDGDLMNSAVEELLRYASPLETATERYAAEDLTICGVDIPKGSLVFAALASANRDESEFREADHLDVSREPNRHLSFGIGPHYCLGAPLARLEAQIALRVLLDAAPQFQMATPRSKLKWRSGLVLRGLNHLPIKVTVWR